MSIVWLETEHLLLLLLVLVANGAPVLAKWLLPFEPRPLDGGLRLGDGQPLFGRTKTVRGIVAALLATVTVSLLLGYGWQLGLVVAVFAMLGDLFSSFIKRRLGRRSSSMALGLDQVPEALFPLLAARGLVELGWCDIGVLVLLFFVLELLLSRILYHLRIRRQPY
jgi:CDP-2,3-bis-(O-geranylgeranyl)-sn-glycerol synthase